jgi:hypothetical protein
MSPLRATAMLVIPLLAYGAFSLLVWSRDSMAVDSAMAQVAIVTRTQGTYAELNGGFNEGDLSCLEKRGTCIPSKRDGWVGKAFVESSPRAPSLADLWRRTGRAFTPGPPADAALIRQQGLSPSSVRGFRCLADASSRRPWWASFAPLSHPPLGFCGDGTGRLCTLSSLPTTTAAECPPDCTPLEE